MRELAIARFAEAVQAEKKSYRTDVSNQTLLHRNLLIQQDTHTLSGVAVIMHVLYSLLAVLLVTSASAQIKLQQVDRKVPSTFRCLSNSNDHAFLGQCEMMFSRLEDDKLDLHCADQSVNAPSA